jgi:NAD(P)-dependent dehydrogenase (short-subunit alcohol dehydrogenase family)
MATVLITGGSSGIGLATVRRLSAAGDRVFCASRHPEAVPLPADVVPLTVDVADPAACEKAVLSVVDAAGRLDALVNNAGACHTVPLEEAADEEAHQIFEVNVFGPMRLARAALPAMRAQGGGRIVNVTSGNDIVPAPFSGWYSASKVALASLSAVLGAELHGTGISVTVVAPGLFRTAMSERLPSVQVADDSVYAKAFERLRGRNAEALESAGDTDEVARAIEECLRADEPPARVVVGQGVAAMEQMIRESSAEKLAALLRDHVAGLMA